MALEKVSDILKAADKANTSVIAFNCVDYHTVHSVVKVADELHKPVIIQLYPEHDLLNRWIKAEDFAAMTLAEIKRAKVPVGLHLDHSSDFDYIVAAMKSGFQSVMYDGSMLPIEENVRNTRQIGKVAHAVGVDVEAEIGHVGFADTVTDQSNLDLYTKAQAAARFCEESGCDSVAIAVGTAHGFYKETPHLDMKRLKEINQATDTPLVMHGGSGVPVDQLEVAFREGINKFNVGTEFLYLYYQTMKEYCEKGYPDFFGLPALVQDKLQNYLRDKMQLSRMTV